MAMSGFGCLDVSPKFYGSIPLVCSFLLFFSPMQASDAPFPAITAEDIDRRIEERVEGDLKFLDGATGMAQLALNKHVRKL